MNINFSADCGVSGNQLLVYRLARNVLSRIEDLRTAFPVRTAVTHNGLQTS